MSMTREEAIEILENGGWWESLIPVTTMKGRDEEDKLHEAIDLAISALRPITREQVEKVWRGEWRHAMPILGSGDEEIRCSKCGNIVGFETSFCPYCGSPITDKAVDMVTERLEALHSEAKTD